MLLARKNKMSEFKIITEIEEKDLKEKKVLLRLDLNIPFTEDGKVANDYRIQKSLDTVNFLKENKAKIIILAHIGREKTDSLKKVSDYLQDQDLIPNTFVPDIYNEEAEGVVNKMNSGDVIIFENLRQHDGEKEGTEEFIDHLSSFGDIYVNEAFSVAHRNHSSITGIPKKLPAYAGIRLSQEVEELSKAFNPPDPFLLIVGGAKFETKLPLVKKFTSIANMVFLGGALSNDIYRYQGFATDSSITSDTHLDQIEELFETGKILVPADVILYTKEVKLPSRVNSSEMIMDAGPQAVEVLGKLINSAKLIVWNGPLGFYEKGFTDSTNATLENLIKSDAEVIIGGGDLQVAISNFDLPDRIFVSTGGGAMLDFLSNGILIGIEALKG